MTEQPPTSFRHALGQARLLDRDDFHALFWHDTIGIPWLEIVAAARTHSVKVGARLLIIDTLGQFTGLRGDAENNAGKAIAAMQPLQEAAAAGLGVLVLRHERKGGGEVGDFGRGSSAFAGAVDVILSGHVPLRRHRGMKNDPAYVRGCRRVFHSSLRRAEGASRSTIRHLHVLSRFDEAPDLLVIELTPDGYVALGTETAVAEAEARERILTTAPTSEADALTETELLAACGVKRTIGRDSIGDHLAADRLRRLGAGKRGDPFRFWQPQLPAVLMVTDGTTGNPSKSDDADFTARRRA